MANSSRPPCTSPLSSSLVVPSVGTQSHPQLHHHSPPVSAPLLRARLRFSACPVAAPGAGTGSATPVGGPAVQAPLEDREKALTSRGAVRWTVGPGPAIRGSVLWVLHESETPSVSGPRSGPVWFEPHSYICSHSVRPSYTQRGFISPENTTQ